MVVFSRAGGVAEHLKRESYGAMARCFVVRIGTSNNFARIPCLSIAETLLS